MRNAWEHEECLGAAGGTHPVQPVPPVGREGGRLRNEGICKEATKGHQERSRNEPHPPGQPPLGHPRPLCSQLQSPSSVSFQLRLISSLASSRADIPLPKILFLWQPSHLTLQGNAFSSLSFPDSSSLPWFSSILSQAFKGSFFASLLPSLVPAPPPARALDPRARGSSWGGLRSRTHRCRPGSGFGELQGEQSRLSGRAKHPMPCRTAHSQPHRSSWGLPGALRAEGLPERPRTAR